MSAVAVIAGREVLAGIHNRWMLAATLLLGVLALTLAFVGSSPVGAVNATRLSITVVSLSSLSVFLVPLIGLLVSYEALVGEIERGTMPLLLTRPVTRWRIVLGKFAGQVAMLAMATVAGFGIAALVAGLGDGGDAEAWGAFGVMLGGSILLGAAFIALGTLFSAVVAERGTAAARPASRRRRGWSSSCSSTWRCSPSSSLTRGRRSRASSSARCCCSIRPTSTA